MSKNKKGDGDVDEQLGEISRNGKEETSGTRSTDIVDDATSSSVDNSTNDDSNLILDNIVGEMPDVQEHAIETVENQKREEREKYSHLVDSDGIPFNPSLHRVNPKTGEPTVSKTGKLMKKPGKKSSDIKSTLNANQDSDNSVDKIAQSYALGKATANLISNTCVAIFQDDAWYYKSADKNNGYDEREYMEKVWADYYLATGRTDLPPGVALAIGLSAYAAPRFSAPKTKQKTKGWADKIKIWWKSKQLEKEYNSLNKKESKPDNKKTKEENSNERV